jgi:hypothetical protein
MPRARLELARLATLDPKSSASTNFATSARPVKKKGNFEFIEFARECLAAARQLISGEAFVYTRRDF